MIPYGRQDISEEDIEAVAAALRSELITQGEAVPTFEAAVAARCGAGDAVAMNSGTSALHAACLALGVGPGTSVWTSPITFVASANCALYCGASVDFVDIDPLTYNLSVERLAAKLEAAAEREQLPGVVIPVHMAGQPCDMRPIKALSERYGFRIIEDASHAMGALYDDKPVGGGIYSDITVFSLHPVKMITTGEGGMALTNDKVLADRMRLLRSHGITRETGRMSAFPDGPWYYEQIALGFNYRMTDVQAALGLSQLRRLDAFLDRRRAIAQAYDEMLADLPLATQRQHPLARSAWHLYVIRVGAAIGGGRGMVVRALRDAGIGANVHYIPVPRQPYYRDKGFDAGNWPEAELYYSEALTLPIYPALSDEQQLYVVSVLRSAVSGMDDTSREAHRQARSVSRR